MSENNSQKIRERAHQIWEQAGRPDGHDADHWRQAEAEIHEGMDAESAKEGPGSTRLAQTDEAEATAAQNADELQEGGEGERAAERLSKGDDLGR